MDFGVGCWNVRGGTQGDKATNELSDKKVVYIMERISCDDLDVVWLTEVWGNRKSLKRLAERFTTLGFNYSVLQGSLSPDRSRRTGGIVALFKRSTFKYVRWIDVGSTSRLDHLGNLADLVLIRRGREEVFHFLCMYGPHPDPCASSLLLACQLYILALTDRWLWAGDFNLLVAPGEAAPRRVLGRKDERFAVMVGEQDARAAPTDDALRVGSRVRLELEPGAFTFRRGASGSNIDHAVVPCSDLYSWESVRTLHPPDAARASGAMVPLSDHAFVYLRRYREKAVLLGEERLVRFETKRAWGSLQVSSLQRTSESEWGVRRGGVAPHLELGRFCETVVQAAKAVEHGRKSRITGSRRERPTDSLLQQVKHWEGVNKELARHWKHFGYLLNISSPLYRSRSMRDLLVRSLRRGVEAPHRTRAVLHAYAAAQLTRTQALRTAESVRVSRAEARGSSDFTQEAAADMVNRQWAELKSSTRTPLVKMRVIDALQPDGSRLRVTEGEKVLDEMRNHGVRQQGPSPAHIAFSKALVDAFVPQWPELRGSDGGVWDLRTEFDFEEFTLTLARMADKACGRDGMQLGFIRMLSREMQWQFWDLLIRCAELGTFPDVWATVTAVLIPKKSGSSIRIDEQRDIWLQCIGPKTLMKMVVGNVFEPLRARILPCSAGAVAGRGCGELVWRMVLAIWQTHLLQTQVYMLWVDLSKCFMTFSRAVGQHTQARRGVPSQVRKAVWNLYSRPRGSFDSAFGCCSDFGILRGYLQGTLEAPDMCIGDMNVLCEIMNLKVVGLRWWSGDVHGTYTVQTVFVDDGCAVNGSADMQSRSAFVWSLWAFIYGTEINVKPDASKTAVSGLRYMLVKGRRHLRRACPPPPSHRVYLLDGRECPGIHFTLYYTYLGQCISLSGSCLFTLEKLRAALAGCLAAVRGRKADRRTQVSQANSYVLGHCLQKGVALWITFETADRVLGPVVRSIFSSCKGGSARARLQGAPAWQVHAPLRVPTTTNSGEDHSPRKLSAPLSGYGLWHPFAAAGAGAHLVFWAEMSSTLPERYLPAHSAYALAMYVLGCRGEDPAQFDYSRHAASLNMEDPMEASLWRLWWARSGRCGWRWADGAPPAQSALRCGKGTVWDERRRSLALWQGRLWTAGRATCRGLMRLGIDELAHVCSASGSAYLTFGQAQDRWPVPAELRHEWDALLGDLVTLGSPLAPGCGHLTPREMHVGHQALWRGAGPVGEGSQPKAARTGETLGSARHPSNLAVSIGHLRDPRRSWLSTRRAQAAAVVRARPLPGPPRAPRASAPETGGGGQGASPTPAPLVLAGARVRIRLHSLRVLTALEGRVGVLVCARFGRWSVLLDGEHEAGPHRSFWPWALEIWGGGPSDGLPWQTGLRRWRPRTGGGASARRRGIAITGGCVLALRRWTLPRGWTGPSGWWGRCATLAAAGALVPGARDRRRRPAGPSAGEHTAGAGLLRSLAAGSTLTRGRTTAFWSRSLRAFGERPSCGLR